MEQGRKAWIYMDQNVWSQLAKADGDWRASEFAKILLDAQSCGTAEVWVGPTNVIETVQASNLDLRRRLASIMLELIEARRMWWGHEFEAINEFFMFLEKFAPDAIRSRRFFEYHGHRRASGKPLVSMVAGREDGPDMGRRSARSHQCSSRWP